MGDHLEMTKVLVLTVIAIRLFKQRPTYVQASSNDSGLSARILPHFKGADWQLTIGRGEIARGGYEDVGLGEYASISDRTLSQ